MRKVSKCLLLCAAAGLAMSSAAMAQPVETNLIANPGFESVDTNTSGPFTSVLLLDWIDVSGDGDDLFAYPYTSLYSGSPQPPDSGDYHYSGGFNTSAEELLIFQTIDVSGGPAGTLIQSNAAFFNLSAYFSTYFTQDDANFVRVFFLDSMGDDITPGDLRIGGGAFLDSLPITDGRRDWGQDTLGGPIPAATRSILVAIGASDADTNHDGYVDNVDFRVTATNPAPAAFVIQSPSAGQFFDSTTFTVNWADAFNATTYSIVVSPNADLSSPVFTQTGLTESERAFTGQIGTGIYYVQVTAVNSGGSTVSSNGPIRFAVVAGTNCPADFNNSGGVTAQDIFDFLAAYFAGC
ncbi:MAG: hypothetical protein ACK4WH_02355 [Phycisphaerales bacterium]